MLITIGSNLISAYEIISDFFSLMFESFKGLVTPPFRFKDIFQQLSFVGAGSVGIVGFCVSAAAMVAILESSFHMKLVIQNDSMVPGFAAMLILRELGAVVTALLLTSRVGAGIAAEVGSMQVTEQIDALKMLGIDPVKFIVVPRLFACILGAMALTAIANVICIICAMIVSDSYLSYSPNMFMSTMRNFVHFKDLLLAMVKGGAFGAVIPIISCFFGFRCKAGAEGVGLATTNSVVAASVAIIFLDFVLGYLFTFIY